jgi:hypothetical protein
MTPIDFKMTTKMRLRGVYRYLRNLYRLLRSELYDLVRYLKHSPLGGSPRSDKHYDAYVTMDYHRLEKGLALRGSRPGFGQKPIQDLVYALTRYRDRYASRHTSQVAANTLVAYQQQQSEDYKSPTIAAFLWFTDKGLRKVVPLADHGAVIMMIAVGHLPEVFRVTHSPRLPLEATMTVHRADEAL